MTSILSSTHLEVRIFKYAIGDPTRRWSNSYEISSLGDAINSFALGRELIQNIAESEASFHNETVAFDHGILSTWLPDSHPYDPAAFVSQSLAGITGQLELPSAGTAQPRNMVLKVRRVADYGRQGKLSYRGVLNETDVTTSNALEPTLASGSLASYQTALDLHKAAILGAIVDAGMTNGYHAMIRLRSGTVEARAVTDLEVDGVGFNKPNHKYYDVP